MGLFSFATDLVGGLWSDKQSRKSEKRQQALASYQFETQRADDKRRIQDAVADARAAGVHPLFALGGSASASPTIMAGQAATGSHTGDAIARAGERFAKSKGDNLTAELLREQIKSERTRRRGDEIANMRAASELAKAKHQVDVKPGAGQLAPLPPDEAQTIPLPPRGSTEWKELPPVLKKRAPVTVVLPNGRTWTVGPSATTDEMTEYYGEGAEYLYSPWKWYRDWRDHNSSLGKNRKEYWKRATQK